MKEFPRRSVHRRVGLMLFACLLLPALSARAEQIEQPARDRTVHVSGTATIEGRVIDGHTGGAIPRARVRLVGAQSLPSILSDANGKFTFTSLVAGDYSLIIEKPTYLTTHYPELRRTLRSRSRAVSVRDGQSLNNVDVKIYHGGSITGRVVDTYGDPVTAAQVRAVRNDAAGLQGHATSTNDIGEFRLGSLEPGEYVLMVEPGGIAQTELGSVGLLPTPTFYPNVASRDLAQAIVLKRGAAVAGLEITILESERSTITGSVVGAGGQFVSRGSVLAVAVQRDSTKSWIASSAQVNVDGTFQLSVPPGNYELQASTVPLATITPAGAVMSNEPPQFGTIRVAVTGNVSGVVLSVGRGAYASGRVMFEGANPPVSIDRNGRRLGQVTFVSPNGGLCRMAESKMTDTLTFNVEGLIGTCVLRLNGSIENWYLKSALYNGTNLLDQPITFAPGQQIMGIDIVLSDRRSELRIDAIDEHGQPTRDYAALIFSTDSSRWADGSRYVRSYIPQTDPRIDMIVGLPSGEYFAVALEDIELDALRDPIVLSKLAPLATRFTVGSADKTTVHVRRIQNPFGSQ
jgi:hypothetical protein